MIKENIIKTKYSRLNVMYIALVLIGIIAIYNWTIAPHKNYIQAAQRCEKITCELEKKNQIELNNLKKQRKELKSLQEKLSDTNKILFTPKTIEEFVDVIPSIVESCGCTVEQFSLSSEKTSKKNKKSKDDTGIYTKNARLIISGDYPGIYRSISEIQNRTQKVYVDEVKMYPANTKKTQLKCDIKIFAHVIYK
ncbi:MAG: hypothetical protein ACYTEE_02180 [Planctomycetota bacterium]|jgi:Tfp pilus assembly protein PilO